MNIINTKWGNFEVTDNGNGGASLFMGKAKICEFPKVAWWNMDAIEKGLEEHSELIEKRINERVVEFEVKEDNVADILVQLIDFFGNEQKGFYASRLKQCLNKFMSDRAA